MLVPLGCFDVDVDVLKLRFDGNDDGGFDMVWLK